MGKRIEPIILDLNFNKLGVCDDFKSFIWASRYYKCGDFEITTNLSEKSKQLFKKDFYIMRDDDESIGIIEKLQIKVTEDEEEILIISGRFLSSILGRRIIANQTQINSTISNAIYGLINEAAISPIISNRKIPKLITFNNIFHERISAQYTGKNLLTTIEELCEEYNLGFNTTLTSTNDMVFKLYRGIDRSYNQSVNPRVIFSDEYDNLLSSEYIEDFKSICTDVLVAGEGEGKLRKTLWVSKEANTGINRHELFDDARNMSTNDGETSLAEYENQLREKGFESITNFTKTFNGTVYFDNINYKKDVFLGDICVIENARWGIFINSKLIEVIEAIDESGNYSIIPTFGV